MKFTFYPKSMKWRLIFGFLVVILLVIFHWRENHYYFDLHSGQVRQDYTIYGIPVSWKIEETLMTEMLKDAKIMSDKPPRWVRNSPSEYFSFFCISPHDPWCCGLGFHSTNLVAILQRFDDHYKETGDERFFIPEDMRKRFLLFALEWCEETSRRKEKNDYQESQQMDIPWGRSAEECVEFMDRFREKPEFGA